MGRRSDHNRVELKQMALDAAQKIVEREGYDKLTTRRIAGDIGYTVGTLYNIFENLDDLIMHINGRTLDNIYDRMKALSSENIREISDEYIRFGRDNYFLWQMLFERHYTTNIKIPEWYREKIDKIFILVEGVLFKETGKTGENIKRAVKVLWAGLHGICSLSLHGKLDRAGAESAKILADSFLDNYLTGLKSNA